MRERELEDNMTLMSYCDEISSKEEEVRRFKSDLRRMGLEQYDE